MRLITSLLDLIIFQFGSFKFAHDFTHIGEKEVMGDIFDVYKCNKCRMVLYSKDNLTVRKVNTCNIK